MLQMKKELNELLVRKEQEWEKLQACQLCFQKTTLQDTRKQLQEMHKKFNRLKEDFTYNLGVLEERDRELERYDAMFTHLKMAENAKQAEVSDLRIQLDKLQQTLVKETRKQEALQYQYQQKLKEHQLEMERLHSSKVSDIDHHSEEYKKLKQELERKLQEVEGELALQKQELLVEFDAEIKKREHAFQRQADEMSNLVLSHELKGLSSEAAPDSDTVQGLGLPQKHPVALALCARLQEELTTLKTSWDSHLAQISKETVSKDLQIQSLHEEEVKLRAELARFQQDIERYKQQLSLAAEREQILERAKVQAELDWQRRCENAERNQYQKSEDLIQSLSTARDQVIAQLQEKEQKLCEMETVLSALTFERDQAVQALQKHGILPEGEKQTFLGDNKGVLGKDFPAREIQRLKEQNTSLRAAIAEMRKEMETLSDQTPSSFPRKEKIQYTQQTAPDAKASTVIFTPGAFCADEVFSGAPLKNLEARTAHLDSMVTQHIQKVTNRQTRPLNSLGILKIPFLFAQPGVECSQHIFPGDRASTRQAIPSMEQWRGLQHYISSKQCPVHTVYGALYPKELANEAQHRLSALEHLQYQLTTRELQYAQRQRFSRLTSMVAFPSSIESLSDENVPSTCGETAELPQIQTNTAATLKPLSEELLYIDFSYLIHVAEVV
ncbi:Coiled-coil domain-containing protein 57 [Chelonia mydas]|uniref:Coiled-coil domain-containing protein 57 n=1 Tax=Chelonia mydas TaxID=8469 RepID=M7BWH5_CHEMY|nr:Coiled-coil domain-containing protein 57 [Chelonia mydas]